MRGRARTSMMIGFWMKGIMKCVPSDTTVSFTPWKRSKITALCPPSTLKRHISLYCFFVRHGHNPELLSAAVVNGGGNDIHVSARVSVFSSGVAIVRFRCEASVGQKPQFSARGEAGTGRIVETMGDLRGGHRLATNKNASSFNIGRGLCILDSM